MQESSRPCAHCGVAFQWNPQFPHRRFCSKPCQKRGNRTKLALPDLLACADCGTEFQRKSRGPVPKRCPGCAEGRMEVRQAARRVGDRPPISCPDCGVTVERKPRSRRQRCVSCAAARQKAQVAEWGRTRSGEYSSLDRRCRDCGKPVERRVQNGPWSERCDPCRSAKRAHRNRVLYANRSAQYEALGHVCLDCGVEVFRRHKGGPFPKRCHPCGESWRVRYKELYWQKVKESVRVCVDCAQPFEVPEGSKWRKRCATCHDVAKRNQAHEKRNVRRARILATATEKFDAVAIFEASGWICGLCDEDVDPTLKWPDPFMQSLDHIVPLAKGGGHVSENVQLAHLVCNVRKGTSLAS